MRLLDWMRQHKISDDAMATSINEGLPENDHCSGHAVRKWKHFEREAPAAVIARIEEITDGEVTLRDHIREAPSIAPNGLPESERTPS